MYLTCVFMHHYLYLKFVVYDIYALLLINSLSFSAIMTNPVKALLSLTKLNANGDNYIEWKSNLYIRLILDKSYIAVKKDRPSRPQINSPQEAHELHTKWVKSNIKAKKALLSTMLEELEKEYRFQEIAYEIMQALRERFR